MRRTLPLLRHAAVLAAAALLAVPAAPPAAAQTASPPLPAGVTAGPRVEGISEFRLANGVRLVLIPDPSVDTVTTNMTVLVGSRHEGYGEAGMAHLLEHLLFKGTPRFLDPKSELMKRGARFNGTTSYDRTNYFETLPASDENLAWSIEFEADRLVNAFVRKSDLDSEMTVVRNEFESGENSPFNVLRQRVAAAAYEWHNYGRAIIGSRADIERVPIDRLQAFYRHYYQPDNVVVIVSGKFEPARAIALVAQHFGSIARPDRQLRATYTVEPPQDGEREVTVRRVGAQQLVAAQYHIPPGTHPDYAAIDVATAILTHQPSGRLHKALTQAGLAANTFGGERQLREAGAAYFGASLSLGAPVQPARDALVATIEGFAAQPVTDAEVERARRDIENDVAKLLNDSRSLATVLSDIVAMGDWRFLFWYRDQVARVKREDVQRVAVTYFKSQNRTTGTFIPTDKPDRVAVPAAPDLEQLLAGYEGRKDLAAGETFDPSPENIERRVIRRTLAGGMKLALLAKKTRGEQVVASLALHWGDATNKEDRNVACSVASAMLSRGTATRSREAIRDELSRLRASVNVSTEGAAIDTIGPNLAATLRLAADLLRNPSFPASEFEEIRRQALTSLDSQRTDPGALASLQLGRYLNPYPPRHWLYQASLEERERQLRELKLEDVKRCHAELVGAARSELAIVGDFEPEPIAKLVDELFGDWKSKAAYARIPARFYDPKPLDRIIETPDKANAFYRAAMKLELRDDEADFPALVLGNYLFGGGSASRLYRRVREKDGISYSLGSGLSAGSLDRVADFGISAIYAPENRQRLETAIREELQRVLDEGFPAEELEAGKRGLVDARRLARNQDSALAGRLASYLFLDRTFAWDTDFERKVMALTPDEVRQAMRRHLDPNRLSIVRAGDFAKTAGVSAPTVGQSNSGVQPNSAVQSNSR